MKTIKNVSTEGYKSPALISVQLFSEGVLCNSGEVYGEKGQAGPDGLFESESEDF